MNSDQKSLTQGWAAIAQGCQDALGWVDAVRSGSRRLDNEADKLNLSLLRTRNQANSLTLVARTPMTVGFFGFLRPGNPISSPRWQRAAMVHWKPFMANGASTLSKK